jgi:hypothetical protein
VKIQKMKKATSKDWKTHPLPKKRSLIPADRQFTSREMDRIKRGVIPMEMEDKWFVFFKRNRLYFHRSWTGFCVYIAHFKRKQDGQVLCLIEANRNAKQYSDKDDAYDAKLFFYILDLLLLGRETPFPSKAGESPDIVPIQQWSQVGQAMLSESKSGSKGPAGLMAALDQASKKNYLGDPEVVGNLLRKYRDAAVESRKSKMDPEERIACDHGYALGMADIFLGKVPAFAPMIPWNSPGQIDRWVASELHRPGFEGQSPEHTIANAMACYLNDNFDLAKAHVQSLKSEEWANAEMEKIDSRYIHLLLGIPYQEKVEESDDDDSECP